MVRFASTFIRWVRCLDIAGQMMHNIQLHRSVNGHLRRLSLPVKLAFVVATTFAGAALSSQPERRAYVSEFGCTEGPLPLVYGRRWQEWRAVGEPRQIVVAKDRYNTFTEYVFSDFSVSFHSYGDADSGLISLLLSRSKKVELIRGVRIGAPLSEMPEIVQKHYWPDSEQSAICGDTECGVFQFDNRRLFSIRYECYTG